MSTYVHFPAAGEEAIATDGLEAAAVAAPRQREEAEPLPRRRLVRAGTNTATAAKVGWRVYQQVAAVFAAFGLAAIIGHFWDIGLRGFIATLASVWDQTIRPVVKSVFHVFVSEPLSWFGIHFEVPLLARDYVSVGLILGLSLAREYRTNRATGVLSSLLVAATDGRLTMFAARIAFWPVYLATIPENLAYLEDGGYRGHGRRRPLRILSDLTFASWGALIAMIVTFVAVRATNVIAVVWAGTVPLCLSAISIYAVRGTTRGKRWWLGLSLNGLLVTLIEIVALVPSQIFVFAMPFAVVIPSFLLLLGLLLAFRNPETRAEASSIARTISPLLYLTLLLAVNYWVFGSPSAPAPVPDDILSVHAGRSP